MKEVARKTFASFTLAVIAFEAIRAHLRHEGLLRDWWIPEDVHTLDTPEKYVDAVSLACQAHDTMEMEECPRPWFGSSGPVLEGDVVEHVTGTGNTRYRLYADGTLTIERAVDAAPLSDGWCPSVADILGVEYDEEAWQAAQWEHDAPMREAEERRKARISSVAVERVKRPR